MQTGNGGRRMTTYRVEVYGWLQGIYCHLLGVENLSKTQMLEYIKTLKENTYLVAEEDAE